MSVIGEATDDYTMIIFAAIAGYLAVATGFYFLIAKTAPIKEEDLNVRPALFIIEGGIEKDSRKAA